MDSPTHRLATSIGSEPGYMMSDERRETARLAFPADLHAILDLPTGPVRIVDYTPDGIRFELEPAAERPKVGAIVIGTACFGDAHTVPITAAVVWTTQSEVGLTLDAPGIPTSIVDAGLKSLARLI
ncbi:MAG: PilZ domain-containing protein [Longimicrobiales bacterium]